ncbi:MAG: hypothetical protein KQJ78_10510 [Deltaproteobacteria bacterium]|nr:hypothetical protein [Deltaproteobacteria bacterium]
MLIRKFVPLALALALTLTGVVVARPAAAEDAKLKPYILAEETAGPAADKVAGVQKELAAGGFAVVGTYAPFPGSTVIAFTSPALLENAAKTPFGGYGAVLRASVTAVGDKVQVAYTNPPYWANLYRLEGDLAPVAADLAKVLGAQTAFGSEDGLSAKDLRDYHYMIAMPYFTDQDEVAEFPSHAAALAAVNAGLAAKKAGASKVYEVAVPGTEAVLFGVGLSEGPGADQRVMTSCDADDKYKHTAYMPYELLVQGNKAYALPAKFRIAISFPDLGMGTFMTISDAPGAILDALDGVAGNK